eukprot:TRINITY_DN56694_c0_g1_i1.p1 TRINITY_DN56694_c0_g1~~TRINITY_DN56694_c0_g1_i1.p1  ORF type:complete len:590 (-),score=126.84 TRINITY_DN56694_c0_g1_i1:323-2092(-)
MPNIVDLASEVEAEEIPSQGGDTGGSAGSAETSHVLTEVDRLMQQNRLEVMRCLDNHLRGRQVGWAHALKSSIPPSASLPGEIEENEVVPMSPLAPSLNPPTPANQLQLSSVVPAERRHSKDDQLQVLEGKQGAAEKHKKKSRPTKLSPFLSEERRKEMMEEASCLARATKSKTWEWISGALIISNIVFVIVMTEAIAVQTLEDANVGRPMEPKPPAVFLVFQTIFSIAFGIELALRWICDGFIDFFKTEDMGWNIMDVVCVGVGAVDTTVELAMLIAGDDGGTPLGSLTALRVLRVVRVVRVVRVIRVLKFFRELRMMIFSILGCLKTVVWLMISLGVIIMLFAILFTSGVTQHLQGLDTVAKRQSPEIEDLKKYFGTLWPSFLSLYQAMSGGNDWGQYYDALGSMEGNSFYVFLFVIYITFQVFAVVNIVTGVFVDSAMQSGRADHDVVVHEELENKKDYLQSLKTLFDAIDDRGEGNITQTMLDNKLKDPTVVAFFNSLKLEAADAHVLFALLDFDNSGEISIDEFLTGCYRLQGEASNMDTKIMQIEVRSLRDMVQSLMDALGSRAPQKAVLQGQHSAASFNNQG